MRSLWSGMSMWGITIESKISTAVYPGYGDTRECTSDDVASLVYMIHYGHYGRNVDI